MKTLVVYYSFEGNTQFAAEQIAQKLGADVLKLKAENEPPRNFLKFLAGGKSVIRGEKAYLDRFDEDPAEYDLIVIGTPIWAGRITPAVREFALEHPFEGKKVGLFACSASGEAAPALDNLRSLLGGNEVAATLSLRNPLKYANKTAIQIDQFVNELLRAL